MVNWRKIFSLPAIGAPDPLNIHRIINVQDNAVGAWYAGYSSNGDLLDITGNGRTLADTSAPPLVYENICLSDGNRVQAFDYDGAADYHSVADAAWQDVTTGTYVAVVSADSGAAATIGLFSHIEDSVGGYGIYLDVGVITGRWDKTGASKTVTGPATDIRDGKYHIVHVTVTSGSLATVYLDGTAGTPTSISGYGGACAAAFFLGAGCGNYFDGKISYFRLQNSAMSASEVAREVDLWRGLGVGGPLQPTATYVRASVAYQTCSNKEIVALGSGQPRVGDALLIEGSATQLSTYTSDFSTNWTKSGTCTIAGTTVVLPDGKSTGTTNTFHEGTDAASQHTLSQNFSVAAGGTYCVAALVKYCGTREWIRASWNDGVETNNVYFNYRYGTIGSVTKTFSAGSHGIVPYAGGWYLIYVWATTTQTTTATWNLQIAESDGDITFDGANQDSYYICYPQIETGRFPSSHIPRVAATAASRSADNLTYSVSCLPGEIAHSTHYTKLRIKGEFRHVGLSSMPAGEYATVLEIGGNTGVSLIDKNRVSVFVYGSNFYVALWENADSTQRYSGVAISTFNQWNTFDYVIDFTDLSVSAGTLNGSALSNDATMTGSDKHLVLTNAAIRLGQNYAGTIDGNCYLRNIEVHVA